MALNNKFVGYVTRSYEQFVDAMIQRLPTALPEITDYSDGNPFIFLLKVWGGILENLGYYIDRTARNTFLPTTTRFDVAILHAARSDYRVKGFVPATADLTFSLDAPATADLLIASGTEVTSNKGISFYTSENGTILTGQQSISIPAVQRLEIPTITIGTSDGTADQSFAIPDSGIADTLTSLTVDGTAWAGVDTFAYSTPSDTHYKAQLNKDREFEVVFGDGTNGAIPANGTTIECEYGVTDGKAGNLPANEINEIVDNISVAGGLTLSATNPLRATGGADADTLETLKKKIPAHRFTLERAVTEADYADTALLNAGVSKAGARKVQCNAVDVHIVPIGGGIATSSLIAQVQASVDERRVLGIQAKVRTAGQLRIRLVLQLRILPSFLREEVRDAVIATLVEFGDPLNQEVRGSLRKGDLFEVIENVDGIRFSEIDELSGIPYALPFGHSLQLDWNRQVLAGNTQKVQWTIRMQTATEYELFRDTQFLGVFNVGAEVSYSDIVFTVNPGAYTAGMTWRFFAYPYNESIQVAEDSIPTILEQDIFFSSITGGA